MTVRRSVVSALAFLLATAPVALARAEDVYRLHTAVELPVIATALTIAALPELLDASRSPARCLPDCRPESVNALDRWAIGHDSMLAETLSNVGVLALPVAGLALDLADEPDMTFWQDTAIVLEAYALQVLVVSLTKFTARRPRPYVYDAARPLAARSGASSTLSFFSGHSSSAFVTAVAFAETYRRRHDDGSVLLVYGAGVGLASLVAACRIFAGKHFLTDVLAGALVGTAIGLLVPALHERR